MPLAFIPRFHYYNTDVAAWVPNYQAKTDDTMEDFYRAMEDERLALEASGCAIALVQYVFNEENE